MVFRKHFSILMLALFMTIFLAGVSTAQEPAATNTFKYLLPGGCCNGMHWVLEVSPEGVVGEMSWDEYNAFESEALAAKSDGSKNDEIVILDPPPPGMTSYFFKGVGAGTAELIFSEISNENEKPTGHKRKVTLSVDNDLNISVVSEESFE